MSDFPLRHIWLSHLRAIWDVLDGGVYLKPWALSHDVLPLRTTPLSIEYWHYSPSRNTLYTRFKYSIPEKKHCNFSNYLWFIYKNTIVSPSYPPCHRCRAFYRAAIGRCRHRIFIVCAHLVLRTCLGGYRGFLGSINQKTLVDDVPKFDGIYISSQLNMIVFV